MTASRLLTPAALAVMASATLTPALSQLALFTHSLIWICAFALAAYLLRTPAQRRALSLSELFLLQGMLTAYFDLLTTPLIACTIPMIALCLLWRQDGVGLSTQVGQLAVCGIAWAVGYVGFWTAKCVLALWLVPGASLHDLLDVVAHRASDAADDVATGHHASRLDGIRWLAWQTRFTCLFVGALAALASIQAALRGRLRFDAKLLPLALVAAAPLGWAVVVLNHTVVHYWFVAPVLIPSFFIIAYLAIEHMLAGKAPAAAGAPA